MVSSIHHTLTYTSKYTASEKKEFINRNVKLQCLVYSYAEKLMPGTKIEGGYYDSYYKYRYSKVGLVTNRAFTWINYSNKKHTGKMQWYTKYDDYDFNVTNDMIKEINIAEIEII